MRTRLAASITVLSLTFAAWGPPRAAADGEKTYDLSRRDRWQAGDVRTRSGKRVDHMKVKITAADGAVTRDDDTTKTLTFSLVEQCAEADADGNATKWRVFVKEWEISSGGATESGLKGVFLVATGRGMDRAYTTDPPDRDLTPDAKAWLDQTFSTKGGDSEGLARAATAEAPVAVGATWTSGGGKIADGVGSALPIDRSKATSTGTLVSVDAGVAHVTYDMVIPFTGLPTQGGAVLPWTSGGAFKIKIDAQLPLAGRVAATKASTQQSLSGVAAGESASIEISVDATADVSAAIGGEMPKPPEAPKPPDSPPK